MFKNPFLFNGRIQRTEYAISFSIYIILYIVIRVLTYENKSNGIFGLALIPAIWFLWAQGAKRCHDIDKSGWYQIIPFYFIVLLSRAGDPEANQFDPEFVHYGADDYEKPYDADALGLNNNSTEVKG